MLHTLIAPPYLHSLQCHAVNNSTIKLVAYICAPSAGRKIILQNVMLSTAVQQACGIHLCTNLSSCSQHPWRLICHAVNA